MQQDTADLKYINNSESLLYRKKQLEGDQRDRSLIVWRNQSVPVIFEIR